ncbi:unnamed protein product [Caenorhabditis sp. 36 PRJEB53466]|nr:unnamed protein product [Caenorhabditis sp. 36 PRJEB53466]
MNFVTLAALFLALFNSAASQLNQACLFCSGVLNVPEDWAAAQTLLKFGCGKLGDAKDSCVNLVNAADLTSSYPQMYPYIVQLKDIGCKKYCS